MAEIDEAKFMQSLGIDPQQVRAGSIKVEFNPGGVVLSYGVLRVLSAEHFAEAVAVAYREDV